MRRYNPKQIEPKWQKVWDDTGIYKAAETKSKPKKYFLEYFPYPSGVSMHVGHVRNYTIGDTLARFSRMTGHNVLHPMGWDAFGLPAENYAIKNNIPPRQSTDQNVKTFKQQLRQMGFSYDWSREIDSSQPDYYKWTQWLFLQFYNKDLAYRAKTLQNWCPADKTVLANEQVINKDGVNVCERDGTPVVQKEVEQWFLKITDYADRLIDDLDELDWPESIKAMQRNWIGRSKGALIKFQLVIPDSDRESRKKVDSGLRRNDDVVVEVFTTRPDTIFGATFIVVAPEHEILSKLSISEEVKKYIKQALNKTELDRKTGEPDKTGVFSGAYAINPANGQKIPIWVADYVLMSYGTGAIMGVPAHDARDYDFAKKHKLPIKLVIEPTFGDAQGDEQHKVGVNVVVRDPRTDKVLILDWGPRRDRWGGKMLIGGGVESGEDLADCAKREITEETGYTDVKLVSQSEAVGHGYFYSNVKNQNYSIDAHGFYFELVSPKRSEPAMDAGEKGKFKIEWVDTAKAASLLDDGIHRYFLETLALDQPYEAEGVLVNSGDYDGLESAETRDKIVADLAKKGLAEEHTQYRLHDWTVSRQRYWGCPIPIIYCKSPKCLAAISNQQPATSTIDGVAHAIIPVPESDLPVLLPENIKFKPTGQSPLKNLPEFVNVKCPKCGGDAKRETDTFDTFVDSSWYFLRFADPHNQKQPFARDKTDFWLPVDSYIGGAEHAVVHLLYARFWTKFLYDQKLIGSKEPFKALRNQGMIGGADGRKMGKRYGNVVTPDELISSGYGADALRLYELFIGPYDQSVDWNPRGIAGTYRFLDRFWQLVMEFVAVKPLTKGHDSDLAVQIERLTHKVIKRVSQDLGELAFNTAIAGLMECLNQLYKLKTAKNLGLAHQTWQESLIVFTQLLAPFAPHITEELWQELGQSGSVHVSQWPAWDEKLVVEEMMTLAVQVNGKLRAEIVAPVDIDETAAIAAAKADPKIKALTKDAKIKKAIYVPGRLVSLVI